MKKEFSDLEIQRIIDFFSVGTLKDWKHAGIIIVEVRDKEESYMDPITKKELVLPTTLPVEITVLWTTHGGFLMVSFSPEEELRAFTNIKKPFQVLKQKLGLLNIKNVSNYEDPKFITCHKYGMLHYLFAL